MKRYLTCLVLMCAASTSLLAQKKKTAPNPCRNAMSQPEINLCTRRIFEDATIKMTKVLAKVKQEISSDEGALEKLGLAQKKWLEYRDATCDSEAFLYTGGSIRPTILNICLADVTQERISRLKIFLEEK